MISAVITFLKEAKVELQKVNWLSRQQLLRYTFLVIMISACVALFLGAMDYLFGGAVEKFLL